MADQVNLVNEFGTNSTLTEEEILKMQQEAGREAKIEKLEEGSYKKKVLLNG